LNLNIKRIVFNSTQKFGAVARNLLDENQGGDTKRLAPVDPTLIKQIAGRAGRKSTRFSQAGGVVAAMNVQDLNYVRSALNTPDRNHTRIGIFPPSEMLATFAKAWLAENNTNNAQCSLADIVLAFSEQAAIDENLYFYAGNQELIHVANKLEAALDTLGKPRLAIEDMLIFCTAPCNTNDRFALHMLATYAAMCAPGRRERCAPNIRLTNKPPASLSQLQDLCTKHNVLDLYLWLNFRYPHTFSEATVAKAQKYRAIELIAKGLQDPNLELPDNSAI